MLQVLGASAGVLALPQVACSRRAPRLALAPWSGPPPDIGDLRLRALAYATLAPNAHNTQPWLVALGADGIDLFVDAARLLPETDPPYRQTHVSQGTFLELLVIALLEAGAPSTIEYFPGGEYANTVVEPRPVARVRLGTGSVAKDPLFSAIAERRSNKAAYDQDRALTGPEKQSLIGAPADPVATLSIIDAPDARARIAALCAEAMAVEVRAASRNAETAKWFRFSDREVEEMRDGFGLAQSGRGPLVRMFAEHFVLSREKAADPSGAFAQGAVEATRAQAESAAAFGVLVTNANDRRTQLLAGRAYARVALTATSLGLAMHPMSQSLQEYPEMAETKSRLARAIGLADGSTVQMLFRLGHAAPTEHTPRRDVRAILKAT
jgi:hypothetical protein